jgi:hypothetical protein
MRTAIVVFGLLLLAFVPAASAGIDAKGLHSCTSDGTGGQTCNGLYIGKEGICEGTWHEDKNGNVDSHNWTCANPPGSKG